MNKIVWIRPYPYNVDYTARRNGYVGSIVTRLDDWGSIPERGRNFSVRQSVKTISGAHPASYPMGNEGRFLPGCKAAGA